MGHSGELLGFLHIIEWSGVWSIEYGVYIWMADWILLSLPFLKV